MNEKLQILNLPQDVINLPAACSVVTIGNFDGVHFGHQVLLARAKAAAINLPHSCVVALTFEPHPAKALSPNVAPKLIMTTIQKCEALGANGVQVVALQNFDQKFAALTPEEFFKKILVDDLHCKHLVVGYDFTFGAKRSGTIEKLEDFGREFGVGIEIVPSQMQGNLLVSSSLIRKLLESGDVKNAAELLTRRFYVDGEVVHGHKRGAALGILTANLKTNNECLPADGVYATKVCVADQWFQSVTNIGFNPTFNNVERSIEVHIFELDCDLYGQTLRLEFVDRLRDEIKFVSPEALVKQIQKDITRAKTILDQECGS